MTVKCLTQKHEAVSHPGLDPESIVLIIWSHHRASIIGLITAIIFSGLAALLDRQVMVPAVPESHLVDTTHHIDNLTIEDSLSTLVKHHFHLFLCIFNRILY